MDSVENKVGRLPGSRLDCVEGTYMIFHSHFSNFHQLLFSFSQMCMLFSRDGQSIQVIKNQNRMERIH